MGIVREKTGERMTGKAEAMGSDHWLALKLNAMISNRTHRAVKP